jgi:hypothetical protein
VTAVVADLRAPVRTAAEKGVAVVPGAVATSFLPMLLAELDTMSYLEPPAGVLPTTTRSDVAVLDNSDGHPTLARLHTELTAAVNHACAEWRPNQIFVRRYHHGSTGMSPHQDGVRFRLFVATVTVLGGAAFHLHDPTGAVLRTWPTAPGDLVLLRGTGLDGAEEGRPHHSVAGPVTGPRCSVAFRMTDSTF